jgi:hypothetical protein
MAYKKALIQKVLFHDLQPINNNNNKPVRKPLNDRDGKAHNPERVVAKR